MFINNIIYQVDSFATEKFKGNPAGVVLLETPVSEEWMQNIAMEMNLSETAFVLKEENGFKIKFYSPTDEVDLCGHATLASAHILYEQGIVAENAEVVFNSNFGLLKTKKDGASIVMNFPKYTLEKVEIPKDFKEIIGFQPIEIFQSDLNWILAVAESESIIKNVKPKFSQMVESGLGHLMITAKADSDETDFVVRCFPPIIGIDEDPVTGSAHCALTPYWTGKLGQRALRSHQISERSGKLEVEMLGERVQIKGSALTVFKINIL